jgi:hypothetical protein
MQSSQCSSSVGLGADFWTFAAVEERLVEAMLLWRRSPGGGRWPFAGDGPWALITRRVRMAEGMIKGMDITRLLQDDDDAETSQWLGRERRGALTRDEVARRDEASEWLRLVPERDRALVVTVLGLLARGVKRVPWMQLKAMFGVTFGAFGLQQRYNRAIAAVAKGLNKGT